MALDGNSDGGREPRLEAGGLELSLPAAPGGPGGRRVLGNRSFALYYRQRHPALEQRRSVSVHGSSLLPVGHACAQYCCII